MNSHGLNPTRVLALAKSMGAQFKKLLLVGCEPLILEQDDSGHIGLSEVAGESSSGDHLPADRGVYAKGRRGLFL